MASNVKPQLTKMPRSDPSSSRKTKNDKKAKSHYNRYKKGGSQRSTKISLKKKED